MIVSVANQKGGVGKTTLATHLTVRLLADNHKALLVDADPQKSSVDFRNIRLDAPGLVQFPAVENTSKSIKEDVKSLNSSYDFVVIDVGGRDSAAFRSALIGSHFVIVPLCPSPYDFWGSEQTFEILELAREVNPTLKVFALINMVRTNTVIAKEVQDMVGDFQNRYQVRFFKNYLYDRIVYKYCTASGRAIFELSGKEHDPKATNEFNSFYEEFKEVIHA